MAREKFVVRLLDAEANLLAWAEVAADPKPQRRMASCPYWPVTATQFVVERSGMATEITVHWCDLDVARRANLGAATEVVEGQVFTFTWLEPIWLVPGMRDVPLPGVTVRGPVVVGVPVGALWSVSSV
jgi:hypothetical protein